MNKLLNRLLIKSLQDRKVNYLRDIPVLLFLYYQKNQIEKFINLIERKFNRETN
jgi:hypothetical protein